ncbi:hypothetical protein [Luedemannella helvata]|uniref:Uncharacterized protein n=1 Tax=Luedemannella helvata TaxID=349315 RepID=A0ABP4VXX6_9ACTN
MTKPEMTFVNPAVAVEAAGRLGSIGAELVNRWAELEGRITALHAASPWGGDEVGTMFSENYLPPEEDKGASGVVKGIGSLANALKELGPQVILAVQGSVATDEEAGNSMRPA